MRAAERHLFTEDEYVALEQRAEARSELVNGEILEYVLVAQRAHRVEHFKRLASGQWLLTLLEGDEAALELPSLGCALPVGEVYAQTDALPGDDDERAEEPAPG